MPHTAHGVRCGRRGWSGNFSADQSRARERNRTADLRITSASLCRLSYSGAKTTVPATAVRAGGFFRAVKRRRRPADVRFMESSGPVAAPSDAGVGPSRDAIGWALGQPLGGRRPGHGPCTSLTGAVLDAACEPGWRCFHDLAVPGGRPRIDHLVVTPAGVFVVQCISWPGTVRRHRSTLWAGGQPQSDEVARIRRAAEIVSALLAFDTRRSVPVAGVLSLSHGRPVPPLVVVDGVVAVAVDMLAWLLASRPPLLAEGAVGEIEVAIGRRLRPSGRDAWSGDVWRPAPEGPRASGRPPLPRSASRFLGS